jgi:hypothetical protein
MNTTNFLLALLGISLILCYILMLIKDNEKSIEPFTDPVLEAIQEKLKDESPEQLKGTVKALQQRLIDYGYAPDVNTFVKKTELGPNDGKCIVATAEDRDKYISKSDIPSPGPRIDLSQYVLKSSIPPEKVCTPPPEIDYSAYVLKSTIPPPTRCGPCIAPKVKVSAGLMRGCPPAPECPKPEPCPEKNCPEPKPCPAQQKCPEPAPCPTQKECEPCDAIRYIKVPAVITKTVTVDTNGNVISQKIDSGNTNPTQGATPTMAQMLKAQPKPTPAPTPSPTKKTTILSAIFNNDIPTTTFPVMSSNQPNTTLAQNLDTNGHNPALCPSSDLNSEFKSHGIYGPN